MTTTAANTDPAITAVIDRDNFRHGHSSGRLDARNGRPLRPRHSEAGVDCRYAEGYTSVPGHLAVNAAR